MRDGILLINKPIGPTSRDIVNVLARAFPNDKFGHAGSLDPFASGLLIIGVNQGLKCIQFFENLHKTYLASLKLGVSTASGDKEGEVIKEEKIPNLNKEKVNEVLKSFLGESLQVPPMYSAIKKDGVPLYKLARLGKEVERKPRKIFIDNITLISLDFDHIIFSLTCSKGTYIRSLGEDIAKKLETIGHLDGLLRQKIGKFSLENAKDVNVVKDDDIIPLEEALYFLAIKEVSGSEEKKVNNGARIHLECKEDIVLLKLHSTQKIKAIYERGNDGLYYCKRGIL